MNQFEVARFARAAFFCWIIKAGISDGNRYQGSVPEALGTRFQRAGISNASARKSNKMARWKRAPRASGTDSNITMRHRPRNMPAPKKTRDI
jgi:hypothetical protein